VDDAVVAGLSARQLIFDPCLDLAWDPMVDEASLAAVAPTRGIVAVRLVASGHALAGTYRALFCLHAHLMLLLLLLQTSVPPLWIFLVRGLAPHLFKLRLLRWMDLFWLDSLLFRMGRLLALMGCYLQLILRLAWIQPLGLRVPAPLMLLALHAR
jgi:hypothetical protein